MIGITPLERPDVRLAAAVTAAGGLGVLDLTCGGVRARDALAQLRGWTAGPVAVRIARPTDVAWSDLEGADVVLIGPDVILQRGQLAASTLVLVEVTDPAQACHACDLGADGLLVRGNEAGGQVGELSTFVLVQHVLADSRCARLPLYAWGGIGPHTAAAVIAAGAAGVVLDVQLALLAESAIGGRTAKILGTQDGTRTSVVAGHRVLAADSRREAPEDITEEELAQLLPVGQDAYLAAQFAQQYGDVATAVRAVTASARRPLPGPADDGFLGTRLPVAQGPMTRVSERPEFALAVADEGGLPFVALALSGPQRSRELLRGTGELLGDRPWGVGILGFVPEEVRVAQLEAIREARPTHVIIAGGRPAQAAALEREGIAVFLHVPSPVLLDQFLRSGARRFVFEGAECGGHIGPRNSFPLWEAQIGVLLSHLDAGPESAGPESAGPESAGPESAGPESAGQLQVLFAGGVHDERSAAMVAAMTGPLTERGVGVGVLMGTAYLFTDEAVSTGAVHELFRTQVARAERTEVLTTAPGHAIRCVPSPFTDEFARIRRDRLAEGVPRQEVWAELEALNVGRLRTAAKALERVDDALVPVDEERQLAEGLFMAGEVCVLRSGRTSIAELHQAVTAGARDFLAHRNHPAPDAGPRPDRTSIGIGIGIGNNDSNNDSNNDVAIVGMAGIFPNAPDLPSYWSNILTGRDAVTEVPPQRWNPDVYFDPTVRDGSKAVSKWGGFLPRIPFDPLRFGIPPTALASIEPVQLLALEVARRALDDAFGDRSFARERTSVIFGAEAGSDLANASVLRAVLPGFFGHVPEVLDDRLPRLTPDSFPGMLANVISGRIANRLDLGGTNYIVDAACASSLAALDISRKELLSGTSDVVLCGGADVHNGVGDYLLFSSVQALSPSGRSRPFDHAADGIGLGEGVACLVLKRLADAVRDGDRVYAVVKGVGGASDGKSLGLTAPRLEGQRSALERAYLSAGVSAADVTLVEAHGTGTVVGDRTELRSLTEVFEQAGARPGQCALGSVKSQIGHTKCASGLAGIVKAALALHTGILPPTGNVEQPNPAWDRDSSPFTFSARPRPWTGARGTRRAGVSAFGFGGTNFHVVLAGAPGSVPPSSGLPQWPAELLLVHGRDDGAVRRELDRLAELIDANEAARRPRTLRDLAATVASWAPADTSGAAVALLARDLDELATLVERARRAEADPEGGLHVRAAAVAGPTGSGASATVAVPTGSGAPPVAFLFPGQGSQEPGMLGEILAAFPDLHHHLDAAGEWASAMFPPSAFDDDTAAAQSAALTDTRAAQSALGVAGLVARDLLAQVGVRPAMAAGHSYGELAALSAAEVLDGATLLTLSVARAQAITEVIGERSGAMAAVTLGAEGVAAVLATGGLDGSVAIANLNSPVQTVISGPDDDIDAAVTLFQEAGQAARRLRVACAFHSPAVAAAGEAFAPALARARVGRPSIPVFANRTAAQYPQEPDDIRAELAVQIASPVRFVDQVEAMYAAGARAFVEVGPGAVLTRFTQAILGDRPHLAVSLQPPSAATAGLRGFLEALAQLAVAGVPVRLEALFRGRATVIRSRDDLPRPANWLVDGHLVRTADGAPMPGGLRPVQPVAELTMTQADGHPDNGNVHETARHASEQLVADFLRTGRDMLAAQRDVLLSYLGTPGGTPAVTTGTAAPAPVIPATRPAPSQPLPAVPPSRLPGNGAAVGSGSGMEVAEVVRELISERTGYPAEMIEPDLDLEADLSIDSIKRMEIAAQLVRRIAPEIEQVDEADLEDLSRARTASAITRWLTERLLAPAGGTTTEDDPSPAVGATQGAPGAAPAGERPARYLWRAMRLAPADPSAVAAALHGSRVVLVGSGGGVVGSGGGVVGSGGGVVEESLRSHLTGYGAEVVVGQDVRPGDHVVHVIPSGGDSGILPDGFAAVKAVLVAGARSLVIVAHRRPAVDLLSRETTVEGLRGLVRTAAREFPDINITLVETDLSDPSQAGPAVAEELAVHDGQPVVLRTGGRREAPATERVDLGPLATVGGGPLDDGSAEAAALDLDGDAVVLIVGGGRGITARIAALLASASHCRLVLAGRTPLRSSPEEPWIEAATNLEELRAAFVAHGQVPIRQMERAVREILAQREIADTLDRIAQAGGQSEYLVLDALDGQGVRRTVKEVHQRYGRLDGIIFGAGLTVDQMVSRTTPESFRLVYDTKVVGAKALASAAAQLPEPPRFVVFFGSVATVIGSRGQVGYAAANDALETISRLWPAEAGSRAVTVHWGPWAPVGLHAGMVSAELHRDFLRRDLALIDPDEGPMCLLRELAWGPAEGATTVIYAPHGWLEP